MPDEPIQNQVPDTAQQSHDPVDQRVARIESMLAEGELQSRRMALTRQAEEQWNTRLKDAQRELEEANRAYQKAVEDGIEGSDFAMADSRRVQATVNFQLAQRETEREKQELMRALQQKDMSNLNAWRQRNPWYQTDERMTASANAIHQQLMSEGRVQEGSTEYFREIDNRMRQAHPEHFGDQQFSPGNYGYQSPARAAQNQGRPQAGLRMDASQVNAMKRMGMTPDNWAAGRQAAVQHGFLKDQPVHGNLWVN